jgi:hypothetical protein
VRRLLSLFGAALALLLAGAFLDSARAATRGARRGDLREALQAHTLPFLPGTPVQAAVILQRHDCTGNLRLFDLLNREDIRPRLRTAVIWYAGDHGDSTRIRPLLPPWTTRVTLRPVPRPVLAELRRLGHTQTPILVVLDQDGRIRFTTQSARTPREFAGLRRIVEGLTWIEEL